jgi:hypothetical protein
MTKESVLDESTPQCPSLLPGGARCLKSPAYSGPPSNKGRQVFTCPAGHVFQWPPDEDIDADGASEGEGGKPMTPTEAVKIQIELAALIDRMEAGDLRARDDLILRRPFLNAWSLQTRNSASIFTPDTTIDDITGEEWALLGRRADRVLQRCTGEFACNHIKGTPGCALSYVGNHE